METKDYITKIDALATDLEIIRIEHALPSITFLCGIKDIKASSFIALVDHYNAKVSAGMTAWADFGNVSIAFECEPVEVTSIDPMEKLRKHVAAAA